MLLEFNRSFKPEGNCIEILLEEQGHKHFTVSHFQHFVDLDTGVYANIIEGC